MNESIRRLLKSKRSIIGVLTCAADAAILLGLWNTYDHELVTLLAGLITTIGATLIAGRSVSDHGEALQVSRTVTNKLTVELPPSDVDTDSGEG